jgi:ribosomal protein S1
MLAWHAAAVQHTSCMGMNRASLQDLRECPTWLPSLQPAQVRGYVKSVGRAGAFVALSRTLEARVKLANLARSFLPHPDQAFPEGALVTGRIVSAADGRCCCCPAGLFLA